MIKNYLFDLDGTLLPLNEDDFIKKYFGLIGQMFYKMGLEPEYMIKKLWQGTKAMIDNSGEQSNEEVFWEVFHPEKANQDFLKQSLEHFYENDFWGVKSSTKKSEYADKIIKHLKAQGFRVILATNPLFPFVATKQRIEWAGLDYKDFALITTIENSSYAKPNLKYYQMILEKFDLLPEETMMIGNDAHEDMIAKELGIDTYLVTDCLNNKTNIDITSYKSGKLEELYFELVKEKRNERD
jgi:FMN phosphatase YigB (HAD superfamily)